MSRVIGLIGLALFGGGLLVRSAAAEVSTTQMRIAGDAAGTRFVADLSASVPVRAFALADPYRVIVDLPEIAFRLPEGSGDKGRGLISAFRYGRFSPGQSRIVLDVTGPVTIKDAFVQEAREGQPARLVVGLKPTDDRTFERELARTAQDQTFPESNSRAKAPRLGGVEGGEVAGRAERPVIVIDAGHGGVDSGASSRAGLKEKEVVLNFALALRESLLETKAFNVVMTRSSDIFVSLDDRIRIARDVQASLLVSIHADSFRLRTIGGATVYTLSDRASDKDAAELADRENRADVIAGLDLTSEPDAVTDILVDLVRRETKNLSITFARDVVSELKTTARMNKNPHRFAGFKVLRAPDVPSVLIELGYMSNSDDEQRLRSEHWHRNTSKAVARAVVKYLRPQIARSQ